MPFWTPKNTWKGKEVFIIGGGKSLDNFDFSLLTDELAVGCNDAYQLGEEICDVCIFRDTEWFDKHESRLLNFGNPVFTTQRDVTVPWVWKMVEHKYGFHKDGLGYNGNTGSLAINLALILGAAKVYLLGFDMKLTKGVANWHENEVNEPTDEVYKRFTEGFAITAVTWKSVFPGRTVYNVTNDSDLDVFEKLNFDAFWAERKVA